MEKHEAKWLHLFALQFLLFLLLHVLVVPVGWAGWTDGKTSDWAGGGEEVWGAAERETKAADPRGERHVETAAAPSSHSTPNYDWEKHTSTARGGPLKNYS